MANRVVKTEELLHYGVKGMKWDESKKKKKSIVPAKATAPLPSGRKEDLVLPKPNVDFMSSEAYKRYIRSHAGLDGYMDSEQSEIYGRKREKEREAREAERIKREASERERAERYEEEERKAEADKRVQELEENLDRRVGPMTHREYEKYTGVSVEKMTDDQLAVYRRKFDRDMDAERYEQVKKVRRVNKSAKHSNISEVDEFLAHYNESSYDYPLTPRPDVIPEVDKSKSISEMTTEELRRMMGRLRDEREVEEIIRSLRRSAGLKDSYENPAKIDTKTPIDQLYHWGIMGMKWGVRRFQNEDGTRTAAGKRREAEQEKSEDYVKTRESRKKGSAGLSNEELRRINERLRLEADYKNLTTEKMEKAESFVGKALKKAAGEALSDFAKSVMLGGAKLLVKELSPEFAEVAFSIKKPAAAAASKPEAEKKKQQK